MPLAVVQDLNIHLPQNRSLLLWFRPKLLEDLFRSSKKLQEAERCGFGRPRVQRFILIILTKQKSDMRRSKQSIVSIYGSQTSIHIMGCATAGTMKHQVEPLFAMSPGPTVVTLSTLTQLAIFRSLASSGSSGFSSAWKTC